MEAGLKGGTYPAVLNAANEVAVQLFLDRQLTFDRIVPLVADALAAHTPKPADSIETLVEVDAQAREWARNKAGAVTV
jgi:1-deoxy-D-xylulose-5-phosphate reductoisomerase